MTFPEEINDSSDREALTLSMINVGLKAKTTGPGDLKMNTDAQATTAIAYGGATKTSLNQPQLTGDGALAELEWICSKRSDSTERAPQAEAESSQTLDLRAPCCWTDVAIAGIRGVGSSSDTNSSINEFETRERQPLAGDMATHIRVLKTQGGGEARLNSILLS